MRIVPHDISEKISRTMQTTANDSNPSSDIWINRPNTALISDVFLERQKIKTSPVDDVSVAVCHPRFKVDNTMVYVGYVADGKARVASAIAKTKMEDHVWLEEDFEKDATRISIAFDGHMKIGVDKRVEFISDIIPWVFWVGDEGVLYARKLDDKGDAEILAVSNCIDVSAISASDNDTGNFDFGMVVFFVMGGSLFYRQLIDGVWMDGEQVTAAPINIEKIAAFRTWDYRVGVQMQTTDGKVYELYTQYMGIGKRNVEHLDVRDINVKGYVTDINYYDAVHLENIEVTTIESHSNLWWGLTSLPVFAENISDENGDYGYYVRVTFDHPLKVVAGHESQFSMVDTFGITYGCGEAVLSEDGMNVTFKFSNFNVSEGNDLTLYYVAGDDPAQGPGANIEDFNITFTPTGLVRPDIPLPEPLTARCIDSSGTTLAIEFTEEIIPETITNSLSAFDISISEYDMVPGGVLEEKSRVITSIGAGDNGRTILLTFTPGNTTSLQNGEEIIIKYSNGSLCGYGGPVVFFEQTFVLEGLEKKNNPHVIEPECVNVVDIEAVGSMKKITYVDTTVTEHCVIVSDIVGAGVLTHIDDL